MLAQHSAPLPRRSGKREVCWCSNCRGAQQWTARVVRQHKASNRLRGLLGSQAREQRAQLGEGAPGPAAEDEAPGGDLDFDEFLVLSSSSDEEMPPDNEMPEAKQAANEGDLDDQEPVPALDLDEEDELAGGGGSETLGGVIGTLLLTLNAQFHLPHLGVRAALRCLNQAEDPDARVSPILGVESIV